MYGWQDLGSADFSCGTTHRYILLWAPIDMAFPIKVPLSTILASTIQLASFPIYILRGYGLAEEWRFGEVALLES